MDGLYFSPLSLVLFNSSNLNLLIQVETLFCGWDITTQQFQSSCLRIKRTLMVLMAVCWKSTFLFTWVPWGSFKNPLGHNSILFSYQPSWGEIFYVPNMNKNGKVLTVYPPPIFHVVLGWLLVFLIPWSGLFLCLDPKMLDWQKNVSIL